MYHLPVYTGIITSVVVLNLLYEKHYYYEEEHKL